MSVQNQSVPSDQSTATATATASASTEGAPPSSRGALYVAIAAGLMLLVLILTNMK